MLAWSKLELASNANIGVFRVCFQDYSYVYKVPLMSQFVSSHEYSPVELPSAKQEELKAPTPHAEYRPSWQFPIPVDKQAPSTPR